MAGKDAPYAQIEQVLNIVLKDPVFTNGSGPFQRTIQVTTEISDIKVSRLKVLVHPEWAVELGPVVAAQRIKQAAKDYDGRVEAARLATEQELRERLAEVVEDIRRKGMEHLIDEVQAEPVRIWRALEHRVRREV